MPAAGPTARLIERVEQRSEISGSVAHPAMPGQTTLTLSKRVQGGPALSRYFFGYNFEADQGVRPERQGQGNIGSISPARNQNPTNPRIVVARVKGVPPPPEKHLDPGCEIHRGIRRRKPDVTDVARAVAGRDIQAAAKRKRQMGVVAADPALSGVGLSGRAGRTGVLVAERDMVWTKSQIACTRAQPGGVAPNSRQAS